MQSYISSVYDQANLHKMRNILWTASGSCHLHVIEKELMKQLNTVLMG